MLHQRSFAELRALYRSGELSPVDVAASALDHAENINARINALAVLDRPRAIKAAQRSQTRWRAGTPLGPLDGMPVTIKEFAAVEGWPTRRGSAVTSGEPAPASTVFAERLLAAGITPLGKTRAPEFNWKGVTDSPAFGVTRNPWDTRLTPGGSSGGCAAAVSAGIVRVSLGSDAGGSIRIPAAFSGLIGLKPSFGRIPASPLPSAFSQVVHTGPLAAGMQELAEVMQVTAGASGRDWTSFTGGRLDDVAALSRPAASLRIGVLAPSRWADSCAEVRAGMDLVLGWLRRDGFAVQEVDYDVAAASAVGAFFYRVGCAAAIRGVPPAQRHRLDPGLIEFADGCDAAPLVDYLEACRQRDDHANRLTMLFDGIDVLVLPTLPLLAFEAGRLVPPGWPSPDWMSWNPYTPAFNIAQVPALSYPVWPEGSPLPVGVQLVAPRHGDERLIALGAWLERHSPVRLAPLAGAPADAPAAGAPL
jgi:aspartyl-tRNA(Asn)/glutamyl-tRNA(Gln) amidotransferase subunit A